MVLIWGQQRICFVAFFLCVLRCFFSNTKWILGFMQYGELSNDAVLGAKDFFFPIRKLIPPVLVPIDAAVWTESIKRLP
jgi:hypothetical protein